MRKRTIKASGTMRSQAAIDGGSFDPEARTVEVVFATETPVSMYNWDLGGRITEVLEISDKAIDMSRLEAGAPVLDTHGRYELADIMGVVEKAWVDEAKKEARALLRLSPREDLKPIIDDIAGGIIRNVSVGYTVQEYTVTGADTDKEQYRATRWMPAEISFVPVPADHNSGTRAANSNDNTLTLITMEESQEVRGQEGAATTVTQPAMDAVAARGEGASAERTRVAAIMDSCARAGLPIEFSATLISGGIPVEEARAAIIDEVAKRQTPPPTNASVTGADEADQTRAAMETGLAVRAGVAGLDEIKGNEKAKAFANTRMIDLAKDRLRASGVNTSLMGEQEIAKRALATTDFPVLLMSAFNRSLRGFYQGVEPEWKVLGRRESVTDFREKTGVKVDGAVTFSEIPEGGEYKEALLLQDESATVRVRKFGSKYSISDIAIANDDLGVFTRLPMLMAQGARMFEANKVWNLLISNSKAPDGVALFHASHSNLASSGGAISETTLSAARLAIRRQVTPGGKLPLGLKPKYLIVPPDLETTAQKLLSAVLATTTGDVNIFAGSLQVIVSDMLTDTKAWYIAADPATSTVDGLVYAYLNGEEGLKTESQYNFNTDALEVKGKLFFDAKVWGYQGWYKNPGA
ncbi:MAG: Mu-like prophage major head subunit gpT family protein [Edaphocola sp.]